MIGTHTLEVNRAGDEDKEGDDSVGRHPCEMLFFLRNKRIRDKKKNLNKKNKSWTALGRRNAACRQQTGPARSQRYMLPSRKRQANFLFFKFYFYYIYIFLLRVFPFVDF